ncbi:hypothetical protein [Streptomyces hesseae]|uniref:ATP-binding protein n=1 Tax=Streptomyces hesseae TaxID=3075519 RepID=A0ABU2SLR0_9ACTN|nr:hypothetical protein [Streptomyces sp. DSM 40473]MDT0449916.1 hypothetical protein [Streptomyces sp. DSM 40473]
MTSDAFQAGDVDALVAALASRRAMVVLASNSTVNTGSVTGDQRQIVAASPASGPAVAPIRQGPVRPKDLRVATCRFVPPPTFEKALAELESGVSVLVGAPGTGRETCALNLLAHGRDNPVLVQLDGTVDLSRWSPRSQEVHGYLMMEPPDPFALRSWDLSRLEASLTKVGARLLIVVAEAPGLASALEGRLGTPVLRHVPPDPREVFAAHLADICSGEDARDRLLRSLGPDVLDELLPAELPPHHAAQAAEAAARLCDAGSSSRTEVLRALAEAEAPGLVARAQEDPVLFSHLLSLSVYGGLERGVVVERAADLLELAVSEGEQEPAAHTLRPRLDLGQVGTTRQRPISEILRALGAYCTRHEGADATDTVSFFWPTVGDAVREVLCRDHTDLLPLFHAWLAGAGYDPEQIEQAGHAAAAMAVATGGRSLQLLRPLALVPWPPAVEVAARCLGAAVRDPAVAAKAEALLEQWSVAPEAALRKAAAYACRSDGGPFTVGRALRLLHTLAESLSNDADDMAVGVAVVEALVLLFVEGDSRARETILVRMRDWTLRDGIPGQMAALAFPVMAGVDLAWCGSRMLSDADTASSMVQLTGHALNEPATYTSMRDVLLEWCCGVDGVPQPDPSLEELLKGLMKAREPGFLRWLMAVERGPDTIPGRDLATRLLTLWRSKSPTSKAN